MFRKYFATSSPKCHYQATPKNEILVSRCETLTKEYKGPWWGGFGHLQTIYAQALRRHQKPNYEREELKTPDGGTIVLDWLGKDQTNYKSLIVIVPGICSTSDNHYLRHFTNFLVQQGHLVVVYTPRGCATLTSPKIFTFGDTTDFRQTLQHVKESHPDLPLVGVGFSLGANCLIKYLGECSKNNEPTPLLGAISISAGYDAVSGIKHLKTIPFYHKGLGAKLKGLLQKHKDHFKDMVDVDDILKKVQTVEEFDHHFTCKVNGFESVDWYYREHSCIRFLPHVDIPLLLVNAIDDPLVDPKTLPFEVPKQNENVILVTTDYGGHLGWCEGYFFPEKAHWHEKLASEWINAIVENASNEKKEK